MKKTIFAALMLLISFAIISCDSAKKELKAEIEIANQDCPQDMGMIGQLTSIEYDEESDEVVMTLTISKDMPLNITALNKVKNMLKRAMLSAYAKSEASAKLMKDIARADSKFTVVFQTAETNETLKLHISKDEVEDIANGNIDPVSPRELLEINVASTNAQCPMKISDAMTMSSVSLEGNYFVYNYSVNEQYASVEAIEASQSEVRASIKQMLASDDPTIQRLVAICKEANTGAMFRYIGDTSGYTCTIKFESSEL